jgi:hypothetical protein
MDGASWLSPKWDCFCLQLTRCRHHGKRAPLPNLKKMAIQTEQLKKKVREKIFKKILTIFKKKLFSIIKI